jgi:hypothetical protein
MALWFWLAGFHSNIEKKESGLTVPETAPSGAAFIWEEVPILLYFHRSQIAWKCPLIAELTRTHQRQGVVLLSM